MTYEQLKIIPKHPQPHNIPTTTKYNPLKIKHKKLCKHTSVNDLLTYSIVLWHIYSCCFAITLKQKIMTKNYLLALMVLVGYVLQAQNEYVNIPDPNFKNALLEIGVDTNGDEEISFTEAETVKELSLNNKGISSLEGIEAFVNLETLRCYRNQLYSLDLSNNIHLTALQCDYNGLNNLNISNNTKLISLQCSSNGLKVLNICNNYNLEYLNCDKNNLKTIDASNNTKLTSLYTRFNSLQTLNISKSVNLKHLNCSYNQLTTLDISKNTQLTSLNCFFNNLNTLDTSKNTQLTSLKCSKNNLTALDTSKNIQLTSLTCSSNNLKTINTSKNTLLTMLHCNDNPLETLEISKSIHLNELHCNNNQLTSLDVTSNTKLKYLEFKINKVSELDLRHNPNLKKIQCDSETLRFLYIKSGTNFFNNWDNCDSPPSWDSFILNTPNIEYICADESEFECIQNELDKKGYTNCSVGTNCSLSTYETKYNTVAFYPNPVNSMLTINSKEQITAVSFIDISGRLVKNIAINSSLNANINVSNLTPGSYFVKVKTVNNTYIKRVIKK